MCDKVNIQEQKKRKPRNVQSRRREVVMHRSRQSVWVNPKARRATIRSTWQPGYYICLSGKRRIRTLHRLGACYALPDVDYLEYVYSGTTLLATAEFDTVCKLCARKDVTNPDEQTDASATSSSSCEQEQK